LQNGVLKSFDISKKIGYDYAHPNGKSGSFVAKLTTHPKDDSSFFLIDYNCWKFANNDMINLTANLPQTEFKLIAFDINKSHPNQLFIGYDQPTWNSEAVINKLFKSYDDGATWVDISANLPILAWRGITSITTNEANPNEVYVALGIADEHEIHKIYKSDDGGLSWYNYSDGLPVYQTFMIQTIPRSTGVVVSTLQGLYYRNASMPTWELLQGNLPRIAIRDFEISTRESRIYTSTYGCGLWYMKMPRNMLKD
jgi:hypothetical protein